MGFFEKLKKGFQEVKNEEKMRSGEEEELSQEEKEQLPVDGTAYIEEAFDTSNERSTAKLSRKYKYAAKTPATKGNTVKPEEKEQGKGER